MFDNKAQNILNDEFLDEDIDDTTPEQFNEANSVLKRPFGFYGTYL